MLNALNEVMRESYLKDCEIGLKRWNRVIERAGHAFRLTLPSPHFRRSIGAWVGKHVDPQGKVLDKDLYEKSELRTVFARSAFRSTLGMRVAQGNGLAGIIAAEQADAAAFEKDSERIENAKQHLLVITEEEDGGEAGVAIGSKPLDHLRRMGPAIDQVANEDQRRATRRPLGEVGLDRRQQLIEEIEPAVDITDDIAAVPARSGGSRHSPGTQESHQIPLERAPSNASRYA